MLTANVYVEIATIDSSALLGRTREAGGVCNSPNNSDSGSNTGECDHSVVYRVEGDLISLDGGTLLKCGAFCHSCFIQGGVELGVGDMFYLYQRASSHDDYCDSHRETTRRKVRM